MRAWRAYGLAVTLALVSGCERPASKPPDDVPTIALAEPVAVGAGLGRWIERVRASPRPTLLCSAIEEMAGAVLCASRDASTMNQVFARLSLFAEGVFGHPAGDVPAHDDEAVRRIASEAMGHDLRGADLLEFYRLAEQRCPREPARCVTPPERAFHAAVIAPRSRDAEELVVIAFALENASDQPAPWRGNAHHELLHAQYFLDPRYRRTVAAYWASLPELQRAAVRSALAPVYATDRDDLVANELQAYLLQEDAEQGLLGAMTAELAPALRERLVAAGTPPIRLDVVPAPRSETP